MKTFENIIGVDLGGTNIRAGKIIAGKIVHLAKLNHKEHKVRAMGTNINT